MKSTTGGPTYEELRAQPNATGRRNRAELEKARAKGATTWVREEFRRGDDGVIRMIKTQVPTPTDQGRTGHHDDRPRTGRAPRRATNARRRGSRRSPSRRSSERSGDSGDDGPSAEPPSRRRLCELCSGDIPADRSPRARYCSDRHADLARQRRKRERDRARDARPVFPKTADWKRMEEMPAGELERLLELATCACNGGHLVLELDPVLGKRCAKCGWQRPGSAPAQEVRT